MFDVLDNHNVLCVNGMQVGVISAIAPPLELEFHLRMARGESIPPSLLDTAAQTWPTWKKLGNIGSTDPYRFTPSSSPHSHSHTEAFYRTLLLDRDWQDTSSGRGLARISPDMDVARRSSDEASLMLKLLIRDTAPTWSIRTYGAGKCLFRTAEGHIGLASSSTARVGDIVVVAYGSRVSLLLRRVVGAETDVWVFTGEGCVNLLEF